MERKISSSCRSDSRRTDSQADIETGRQMGGNTDARTHRQKKDSPDK